MVKVGQTHRRRDAGEARDGGARWKALAPVRRTVAVAGPGVAGVDGGELGCGRRSSSAVGIGVAGGLGRR